MRQGRLALACAALACGACGGRGEPAAPPRPADAAAPAIDVPAEVPERPLGLPDHAAWKWRRRGGHPAYQSATKAMADGRWDAVVTACRQALVADPGHLDAAWLLAIGLAKVGKLDEVAPPLHAAVAGDFGKWAHASLEHPALAAFRDAPIGKAWQRRVEQDRAVFTAALARALIVTAGGELYGYDPGGPRWHRLTHTWGTVIGGLRVPSEKRIAYVTRQRAKGRKEITLAVGIVDLGRGRTLGAIELGTKGPIAVAYSATTSPGVWIGTRKARAMAWQLLEDSGKLAPLPKQKVRPPGPWLEVIGRTARPRAIPVHDVIADFDDKGLASAIRIGRSNRILSIPSPGLIDGNSLAWSGDRARLAFVAQLDDRCGQEAPSAAAYLADPTTGALRELERAASGLSVDWLSDGRPVVAGDGGVSIVDPAGGEPLVIEGADGLLAARVRPSCTPADDDAPPPPDDPDLPEATAPAAPGAPNAPAAPNAPGAPAVPAAAAGSAASAASARAGSGS